MFLLKTALYEISRYNFKKAPFSINRFSNFAANLGGSPPMFTFESLSICNWTDAISTLRSFYSAVTYSVMFLRQTLRMRRIFRQNKMFEADLATEHGNLEAKSQLEKIFLSAVRSVLPQHLIKKFVKVECDRLIIGHKWYPLSKNVHLVGFGKAVLGMACATEKILKGHLASGILCIPKNTVETFKKVEEFKLKQNSVVEIYEGATNNLPDEDAVLGAQAITERIESLSQSDILLVLISGGGSALLPKPREGLTLNDKLETIKLLASQGATINELNTVRKKLSQVKGGGLAVMSYPRTTIALILSDVVSDPLDIIASGPTVPNTDKSAAAFEILTKYKLLNTVPDKVIQITKEDFKNPCIPVGSKGYCHVDNFLIGNNAAALQEAKSSAEKLGFRTIILSNAIESPVHVITDFYVNLSFEICKGLHSKKWDDFVSNVNEMLRKCQYNFPESLAEDLLDCMRLEGFFKGLCIIAGGETTVEVRGAGVGGRNQELTLMISQKLFKLKQVYPMYFRNFDVMFLGAGTDGIDGNSDSAGAFGCADVIQRAIDNYVDPGCYLSNNDSHNFFRLADKGRNLITTGHTGTNVMDLHILVVKDIYRCS